MANGISVKANGISVSMVERFSEKVKGSLPERIVKNAVIKNGIDAVAENSDAVVAMNHVFSDEIDTGKVSNQKQSGRCWMFAALNTFHHKMKREFQLKDFELSQNYVNFWDKFEKSNYFLESVLETATEPLDGRLVSWILSTPQQDGGQWDMFVSLVKKYGVVPKQAMPETFQSSSSMRLNSILNTKLREDAVKLRTLSNEGATEDVLNKTKEEMLSDIYKILTLSLGEPPKTFNFEYRNKENKFYRDLAITPREFYEKYIGLDLDEYVSIINAPTQDKPYGKTYTVQYLGNAVEGNQIKYLNVDMDTMKQLAIKQIQDNESVWFGCDVGKLSNKDHGIMDLDLYDYESILGIEMSMTKAERLDYKGSVMTHAMVLTGVNLVDGQPNRWKVENSWGEKVGNKGYFVMSDKWMDEYTYQIVVNKKHLSDDLKKAWEQEPIELKPWDPMGSLAR